MEAPSAEFVNPFIAGAYSTIEAIFGESPSRGPLAAEPSGRTNKQVNVIIGVTGEVHGHVILGMSLLTADKMASAMIGQPVITFDALAASAISELTNMICGAAITTLSDANYLSDITPPTVVRGVKVYISTLEIPAIVIPMTLPFGEISLTVALTGVAKCKTAAA